MAGLHRLQELVEGKSLAQMVEAGWQPDHKEVARIARDLLNTFSYLGKQKVQPQPVDIAVDLDEPRSLH